MHKDVNGWEHRHVDLDLLWVINANSLWYNDVLQPASVYNRQLRRLIELFFRHGKVLLKCDTI